MKKETFLKAIKILVILVLLMAIMLLAFLQWKKDFILRRVMEEVQAQMTDSLRYSDATLNWFSSFPSMAIELHDLKVGSGKHPLVSSGNVELLFRLFPLFRDELFINRIRIDGANINLVRQGEAWNYEVFRKKESGSSAKEDEALTMQIRKINIRDTRLYYDDGGSESVTLFMNSASLEGTLAAQTRDALIRLEGSIEQLSWPSYMLPVALPLSLDGRYSYDPSTGRQGFQSWTVSNDAVKMTLDGSFITEDGHTEMDFALTWKDGQPEKLKSWLPADMHETWSGYVLSGKTEGQATIQGRSSGGITPRIMANARWMDGGIDILTHEDDIDGLDVEFTYDSGDPVRKQNSSIAVSVKKGGILGRSLSGDLRVHNLTQPVMDLTLKGHVPASLLNLMDMPGMNVARGDMDIASLEIRDLPLSGSGLLKFIASSDASIKLDDLQFTYLGRTTSLSDASVNINANSLQLEASDLTWAEARATDVKGTFDVNQDQLDFTLSGKMCEGAVDVRGKLSGWTTQPVLTAQWRVEEIEMSQLMTSFSNFDQTFITGDHLSGKANIWAESRIPFDPAWKIKTKEVDVQSAIDIRDGRLRNMKTLEDFAQYVHLEDLQDIRFSQLRNYLKIESGKVYLPVMFIQSSAINLSISGVHGFDQKILYNVKVNAGQAAAQKLKKVDVRKELKQARKSGWINMYFVLEGTTADVRYQQYRSAVISGFEQSAKLKEDLRNHLVDVFGYDLYWLEPNEWEDIPEYK